MKLSQYGYEFSKEMIAQYPEINRDDARLMVLHRETGEIDICLVFSGRHFSCLLLSV